ncbi:MAG: hypothetical protein FJ098_11515 [Deltaproteobacteria bacterium]|nr:hypothetical protein [Deltaproteobacteria bacterium]
MFEEAWHDWGRAALLGGVAAVLAVVWLFGGLPEAIFALVALGAVLAALQALMVVSCLLNLASPLLRAASVIFAGAVMAGALALVLDPLLPAPARIQRTLARPGDLLTWSDGGEAGETVLVRVAGEPGLRPDGRDRRVEIRLAARQGEPFDSLSFTLHREAPPSLGRPSRGGPSSRTDAVAELRLPDPGPVTLALSELEPPDVAPLRVSIHPLRVPPAARATIAWGLFAASLLLGALALRERVRSFFPVAGAGLVAFLYVETGNLGPSAVLVPLGVAVLVAAALGALAGLLLNALLARLFEQR